MNDDELTPKVKNVRDRAQEVGGDVPCFHCHKPLSAHLDEHGSWRGCRKRTGRPYFILVDTET